MARREQQTEGFRERYRRRLVMEHRITQLIRLEIRQVRHFGKGKVLLQALLTAMVANLSLAWSLWRARAASSLRSFSASGVHVLAAVVVLLRLTPSVVAVSLRRTC